MKTREERIENFKATMKVGIENGMYNEAEAQEMIAEFIKTMDMTAQEMAQRSRIIKRQKESPDFHYHGF